MHDEENIVPSVVEETKDCITCGLTKEVIHFKRDSSYRDGYRDMCWACETSPRLSTLEHVHRLKEKNYNSEGVKRQRWIDQEDYKCDAARLGRQMHHVEFLRKLDSIAKNLYIMDGRIIGDLAIFKVYGRPQEHLEGRNFEYLCYMTTGLMPEYSIIEFDEVRDIAIREKQRGWRTVLLKLIKSGIITEQQCEAVFGPATGTASTQFNKQLWQYRNRQ